MVTALVLDRRQRPLRAARGASPRRKPKPVNTRLEPGILHITIHRGRDPGWPAIDRIAIELQAAQLRRKYVGEAFATLRRALATLIAHR